MPKRLLWFVITLGLVFGFIILTPIMDRMSAINRSTNTSLSIVPTGYKALYLLLEHLENKPVALWQHSLMNLKTTPTHTLWLMEPGSDLFFDGKAYARHMQDLVTQGNHLVVVLNQPRHVDNRAALQAINKWYGLSMQTHELNVPKENLAVISHFPTRTIQVLAYQKPRETAEKPKRSWFSRDYSVVPGIYAFKPDSVGNAQVLLSTTQQEPLIVRFQQGQGSLTVVLNGFYLGNGQLNRGDNAPLAVALQEINGHQPALFEVYSAGFNENRDIITYLATGKGIALFITLILILIAFCAWVICQPIRKKQYVSRDSEQFFTQEVFIDSLASHYIATRNWNALYDKLADQFRRQIERKYPGLPFDAQLERIAQSPFFDVSLESLKSVFAMMMIASESDFIAKSQRLLDVQRKVSRYEQQYEFRAGRSASAGITG